MPSEKNFQLGPLGFPWQTRDPFLFCVHHLDGYPEGNAKLGPRASLAGRNLGMDFEGKDGWRMYHGEAVPGFPAHPHRGFETVTLARQGFIDHSDSLGATARFGQGDVQWMTAGRGIMHAEMFPLLKANEPNPVELFQIWLNLPARHKMVEPHFKMLFSGTIPTQNVTDAKGKKSELVLVAGHHDKIHAPSPPPKSWAADPANEVAIWTLRLEPHATLTIPAAGKGVNRSLYFFAGDDLAVDGHGLSEHAAIDFHEAKAVHLENGSHPSELLLLQGKPIGEPVVQHGPFVMNTRAQIAEAVSDFQRTRFGGWPWPSAEPVHAQSQGRFAKHADGKVETAELAGPASSVKPG